MLKENFLYFILSGGVAAGLNFGSRFLFSWVLPFEIAVVAAFFVGLLSGFLLMRFFVFNGAGKPVIPQIRKYVLVNLFALLQTFLISLVLARWVLPSIGIHSHAEALGHLIGVLLPVLTSYFGHKYFTFRERE
jgi:putative flippase GtrA